MPPTLPDHFRGDPVRLLDVWVGVGPGVLVAGPGWPGAGHRGGLCSDAGMAGVDGWDRRGRGQRLGILDMTSGVRGLQVVSAVAGYAPA